MKWQINLDFLKKKQIWLGVGVVLVLIGFLLFLQFGGKIKQFVSKSPKQVIKEKIQFAKSKEKKKRIIQLTGQDIRVLDVRDEVVYYIDKINYFLENSFGKDGLDNLLEDIISSDEEYNTNTRYIVDIDYKKIPIVLDLPADKIVYTGCKVKREADKIIVTKFLSDTCQIAVIPKKSSVYQIGNKKIEDEDYFLLLRLKNKPLIEYVKVLLNNINVGKNSISPYFKINIPIFSKIDTKFVFSDNIQSLKIFKQIKQLTKDARDFGFVQETGTELVKLLPEAQKFKGYSFRKVKPVKNFIWSGNILAFSGFEEGKYILSFKDKNNFSYIGEFEIKKFPKDFIKFSHYPEEFRIEIYSVYPFYKDRTRKSIEEFFSGYKTNIDFSDDGKWIGIRYFIPPKTLLSGNLKLYNKILGELSFPLKIYFEKIPSQYTYAGIEGDKVNILPAKGRWGKHISIGYKNIPKFDLYFQRCKLNLKPDFGKNLDTSIIDRYFFKCDGPIIHKVYEDKNFTRWEEKWIDYPLPEPIKDWHYFRVSFYKDFSKGTRYFKKTDIGVFAKLTKNKLYLFPKSYNTAQDLDVEKKVYILYDTGIKYLTSTKEDVINVDQNDYPYLVVFKTTGDETFSVFYTRRWRYIDTPEYRQNLKITTYIDGRQIGQKDYGGGDNPIKIYGYTDRGLYKPGDTIFFAGWVRDLAHKDKIPQGEVVVKLLSYAGDEIKKVNISRLDSYGGFKGKFELPKSAELGMYQIQFSYDDKTNYYQDIKVAEYQKPTFYISADLIKEDDTIYLKLTPQYYFGKQLSDYDLVVNWQLKGRDICWYCRWWNTGDFYYNWVFENTISTGGTIKLSHLSGKVILKVLKLSQLGNLSYKLTLKTDIKVKDNKTDEVQKYIKYLDIPPKVWIGFAGQPVERLYLADVKDGKYVINGIVKDFSKFSDIKGRYIVYYKPFGYSEEKGPDGSRYYINDIGFKKLIEDNIKFNKNGTFSIVLDLTGAGQYFVRAFVEKDKVILGEVQKRIYYYDWSWYDYYLFGEEKNNFQLSVNIPKKDYDIGEKIPININPYKIGANILITIERGNKILDIYQFYLTGQKIQIPVKRSYYPNVNISVVEFVGEKISKKIKSKRPSEPRFYIGYADVDISDKIVRLNIKIDFEKKIYRPGEKFVFTIYTTDAFGNPVDARLSVAIVDKALVDLYDLIKKPIPYFYNKLGSFVINLSEWKNLYAALKVFVSEGEKGGGGAGGLAQFGALIRDKFYDLAFWRGGVYTKNGKITLQTTLPDNTTTWMIDVIGITKDIKLGTTRAYFKVAKPFMIQANLPTFMTLGDKLQIPFNIVANSPDVKSAQVEIYKSYDKTHRQKIYQANVPTNTRQYFDLSVEPDAFTRQNLYIKIIASAKGEKDGIQQVIPIRSKGFILYKFSFNTGQNINIDFGFSGEVYKAVYNIWVSKFPIAAFEKAFSYLLHYPYGCTEQLTSGLYPILVADELDKKGLPLGDIIKDGKIKLYTRYIPIKSVVEETIIKIFKNQKSDGGLGYWSDGKEQSNPVLSAYVYGALKLAEKNGYDVNKDKLLKLEKYLDLQGNNKLVYLYYLWVRTQLNLPINKALFESINFSNDLPSQVLKFAVYVNLGDYEKAKKIKSQIDWQQSYKLKDWYWTFLNKNILKAIYLRALLKMEGINDEVRDIVFGFLNARDSRGIWGHSTQENVQILLALGDYLRVLNKDASDIKCNLKVNDKSFSFSLSEKNKIFNQKLSFKNIKALTGYLKCSSSVLVDQKVDYIYKDFDNIKSELHNVSNISWSYSGSNNVGDIGIWSGGFKVNVPAQQLAVEFYIPSTYKFLANLTKQKFNDYKLPFDIKGRCRYSLRHYEVRFDRLFLYFGRLYAGDDCQIRIRTIKAYNGTANQMPVHIFEMYRHNVWAIWKK